MHVVGPGRRTAHEVFDELPAGVRRPVGSVDFSWQFMVGFWIVFPFLCASPRSPCRCCMPACSGDASTSVFSYCSHCTVNSLEHVLNWLSPGAGSVG